MSIIRIDLESKISMVLSKSITVDFLDLRIELDWQDSLVDYIYYWESRRRDLEIGKELDVEQREKVTPNFVVGMDFMHSGKQVLPY